MARGVNLTGQRFGQLTVIKELDEKQDHYKLWDCECDCGNHIKVNTKRLKRGTVKDCGCIQKKSAHRGNVAEDLSHRVYGSLRVLHRVDNKKRRTCWLCQCCCGNQIEVTAYDLKMHRKTHCGCQRRKNTVNLANKRFGRLTVLKSTDKRGKSGSVIWHCLCDCGNSIDVSEDDLVRGGYKSCGCLRKELQKNIYKKLHIVDGTCIEILNNKKSRKDNTSGFRGVYKLKNGKYKVTIGFKGKNIYVGTFYAYDEAVSARINAEEMIHEGFVKAYYKWLDLNSQEPLLYEVKKVNGILKVLTNFE